MRTELEFMARVLLMAMILLCVCAVLFELALWTSGWQATQVQGAAVGAVCGLLCGWESYRHTRRFDQADQVDRALAALLEEMRKEQRHGG